MSKEFLIGLRAYKRGADESELSRQLADAREYFPNSCVAVALCGKKPSPALEKSADEIMHYSPVPVGLTRPFDLLVEHAKREGYSRCILTDGDDQHMFSEIGRICSGAKEDALIPVRKNRSLFFNDSSSIDRLTLEEIENAFLRVRFGCMLRDPQPGLAILLDRSAIDAVDLSGIGSMIGDIVITTQVFLKGLSIGEPEIEIRPQKNTLVNLKLEFTKVFQFEAYYNLGFFEVLKKAGSDPAVMIPRGNPDALGTIEQKYVQFSDKGDKRYKTA